MRFQSYALSDIGRKRRTNQDAFYRDDAAGFFIVADGMGGHKGGEVASQLTIDVLNKFNSENEALGGRELLTRGVNKASEEVFERAKTSPDLTGMGTTLIALLFKEGCAYIAQVGDSRAYLIRPEGQWQLTEDHSLLNEEIRAGKVSPAEASQYQFRNVITRSVGYEDKVIVDIYRRAVGEGDIFLACTDGLSGLVDLAEIGEEIRKSGLEVGIPNLVALANARGGDDNITVIAVRPLPAG